MTTESKNPTSLAQAATTLDEDIANLQRLSEQIETIAVDTEGGMNHARKLMARFSEYGARVADGVQDLALALSNAQARAEKAASIVSARADLVKMRQEQEDALLSRFQDLVGSVREVTSNMVQLKKPDESPVSESEKPLFLKQLSEFDSQLLMLIEQMRQLKAEAKENGMKKLERDADALAQSVDAARRRLSAVTDGSATASSAQA